MNDGYQEESVHDGISFVVTIGASNCTCVITRDALKALCPDDEEMQAKAIFWEHEDHINRVARRLLSAEKSPRPLVLRRNAFS